MKQKKKTKKVQKLYPALISISILFMSIGYALINSVILNLEGIAFSKQQAGIYITQTKYKTSSNANINTSEMQITTGTTLKSKILLSPTNATSYITYTITMYNSSNLNYKFDKSSYDNNFYDNTNIIYELTGLSTDTIINAKDTITFDITFKYKTSTITNNVLNSYIFFEFILSPTVVAEYDYSGEYEIFTAPYTGTYKLELWGAQGGIATNYGITMQGGYGGYSTGEIKLEKNQTLYIAVGGTGSNPKNDSSTTNPDYVAQGGWNGGGFSGSIGRGSGGGATSIYDQLIDDGELKDYESNKENIIIVAGGGGGGQVYSSGNINQYSGTGGSGGGFQGGDGQPTSNTVYGYGTGGTQKTGGFAVPILLPEHVDTRTSGSFGLGASVHYEYTDVNSTRFLYSSGGGGGYYGGGALEHGPAGGGSGYIASSKITNKYMMCHTCLEDTNENTKTIATENSSSIATSDTPKAGNGYVKITLNSIEGIYIQTMEYDSNNSADTTNSQIISYDNNEVNSEIKLSTTNANSSITYKVTIYNNDDISYYYNGLLYEIGTDTYSNEGIIVSASNIELNEEIKSKSSKTIYLTYAYKNGTLASNNNLKSKIKINFQEVACPTDGRICDISGNNNHLNIVGATWNRYQGEISTDGVNDYLYIDMLDWHNTSEFTIEFYGKVLQSYGILFESSLNSNNNYGSFYVNTGEYGTWDLTLAMKFNNGSTKLVNHHNVDNFLDKNNYHHYVITLNTLNDSSQYIKMYKDGVYYKTTKVTNAVGDITGLTLRNYPFYIGSRAGLTSIQKMNLKTLRIYTKELTLEEIQNNYAGENILKTNMIASYNFN